MSNWDWIPLDRIVTGEKLPPVLNDRMSKLSGVVKSKQSDLEVIHVKDTGARGNYDPSTGDGSDDTIAINRALARAGTIVLGHRLKYKVTDQLDLTNKTVIHNGSEIHGVGFTDEILFADGSVGTYSDLDSDATKGENRIVCATLASLVSPGDVLRITSSLDFSDGEVGIKQAEMASVRNVVSSTIYLNETLLDSYATADTAKAAIVTLANVVIQGGTLRVVHHPVATTTQTRGIRFKYCHVRGDFEVYGARATAATFDNDWKDDVRADVRDAAYVGTGTSYGLSIRNATMYGNYRGVVSGARLAVSGTGDTLSDGGPSWENHITVVGHTGLGIAFVSSHSNTGSIYWDRCVGIGGSIYDLGETLQASPAGFSCGARRSYINDCVLIRCGTSVQMATNCSDPVEEIIVNGLHIVEGTAGGFLKGTGRPGIGKLVIRNLHGDTSDKESYAIDLFSGAIDSWLFEDIHLTGCGLVHLGPSVADTPDELRVSNFTVKGPSDTEATATVRGVFMESGATSPARIQLRNGPLENMNKALNLNADLDMLELIDVDCRKSLQHIVFGTSITIDHIKVRGGSFRGSRHGSASQGSIIPASSTTIGVVEADGVEMDTDPYLIGNTGWSSITTLILGTLKTHASLTDFVRSAPAGLVQVLSGSAEKPRLIQVRQSPNTVVTAPKGCIAENVLGTAGSTLLWVNTDGATAWTNFA